MFMQYWILWETLHLARSVYIQSRAENVLTRKENHKSLRFSHLCCFAFSSGEDLSLPAWTRDECIKLALTFSYSVAIVGLSVWQQLGRLRPDSPSPTRHAHLCTCTNERPAEWWQIFSSLQFLLFRYFFSSQVELSACVNVLALEIVVSCWMEVMREEVEH